MSHTANQILDPSFWDKRYNEEGYAYGTQANEFLVEAVDMIQSRGFDAARKNVLCLAEGEGRNALFLASKGFRVHAVDMSRVGMEKLQADAIRLGYGELITTEVVDLHEYDYLSFLRKSGAATGWDMIVDVFVPMLNENKSQYSKKAIESLSPGGYFISVTYDPSNIGRGTGGPQFDDLCWTIKLLKSMYNDLDIVVCDLVERENNEGKYHKGLSAINQFLAQKKI